MGRVLWFLTGDGRRTIRFKSKFMFSAKTKSKMLKAQFVVFMTRNRYVGSYPKLKRFVLVNFLFLFIGFIGWNVTLNLPRIEIAWPDGRITVEQPVHAKFTPNADVPEVKEIEIIDCYSASKVMSKKYSVPSELMDKIIKAESGNNPLVENKVSTATGCSQWILGSWRSYGKMLWGDDFHSKNIYSPKDNVELLAWTIANYGTSPWDASRAVWGK